MMTDVIKCIVATILLYFLYPVLLGYCSVWASGRFLPGFLAALFLVPFAGAYGYLIRKSQHKVVLTIVPALPLIYMLSSVIGDSKLLGKSIYDVVVAAAAFTGVASVIGSRGTREQRTA
jgi:hypothetical protein